MKPREVVFENLDLSRDEPEWHRRLIHQEDPWRVACMMVVHADNCEGFDPADLVEHVRDWQDLRRIQQAH